MHIKHISQTFALNLKGQSVWINVILMGGFLIKKNMQGNYNWTKDGR